MVNRKKRYQPEGLARPKQHIELQTLHLDKISTYLYKNLTPVALRFKIQIILYIQFVSRVLESQEQLKPNFFVCKTDDNGTDYLTLSYSTKQNNIENKTLDLKRNFVEFRRQPKTHWYLKKSI